MESTYRLLAPLDWVVIALVCGVTLKAIVWGTRRREGDGDSMLDYLVMGRQLTVPLFTATLVATWYGGIFGVTEIAFQSGIYNFVSQGVFWYATYLIFAFFLVHRVASFEAVTLPEMLGQMFGPKSARVSAAFNVLNVVPIAYTISLGLLIQSMFGGSLMTCAVVGMVIVVSYAAVGGMRSVVYSDLIQFFVMCTAVLLVAIFSVYEYGGLSFLRERLPAGHFKPLGDQPLGTTIAWGLIALSTLVDPNFYQRCFAAKSPSVARRGILLSTCVWVAFDICTTTGAMYARATMPTAASGTAYFTYALGLLPMGLRGLFVAGILCTVLSTLDSYLFVASTTLAHDLGPRKLREKRWFHTACLVAVALTSLMFVEAFEGSIRQVWKTLGSYSAASLLLPVMIGYAFPKRISDKLFVCAALASAVAITVIKFNQAGWVTWVKTSLPSGLAAACAFVLDEPLFVGLITSLTVLGGGLAHGVMARPKPEPKGPEKPEEQGS